MAVPAIVANITTPLLSMVDLAIVGHLGSAVFVAAIAVGGTIFNMLYWLFGFLRFGTSGLTAQAYGANNFDELHLVGVRSLMIAMLFGAVMILLQNPLGDLALNIMQPDADTRAIAELYFHILVFGAPAVLMQYSLTGWFVGRQNTRVPMLVALLVNVINIGASLLLVYVFDLGIRGVAFGTLIAQWIGCVVAMIIAKIRLPSWHNVIDRAALRKFFSINFDIFLRTLCLIAVTLWFTRSGASQGAVILAVNTLLMQMFTLFSYFMDGFAFAGEALCGKYYGAKDFVGLRRCVANLMLLGLIVAAVFTLMYAFGIESIIALLTDDKAIQMVAQRFNYWAVAVPLAGFLAFTADGVAIGLTHTRLMLKSMVASMIVFFIVCYTCSPGMGNHALWLAFVIYLLSRGVILTAMLRGPIKG